MNKQKVNQLFEAAETELEKAGEELSRPSHDVVTYAVCAPTRQALHNYLSSLYLIYAQKNNGVSGESLTVDDLVKFCKRFDPKINKLDFSPLYCSGKDVFDENEVLFCSDIDKVNECIQLTREVRDVVKERLGL